MVEMPKDVIIRWVESKARLTPLDHKGGAVKAVLIELGKFKAAQMSKTGGGFLCHSI